MTRLIDWLLWFWGERRGWWVLAEIMAHKDDLLDNEPDTWARAVVSAGALYRVSMIDGNWRGAERAQDSCMWALARMRTALDEMRNSRMPDEEVRFD